MSHDKMSDDYHVIYHLLHQSHVKYVVVYNQQYQQDPVIINNY